MSIHNQIFSLISLSIACLLLGNLNMDFKNLLFPEKTIVKSEIINKNKDTESSLIQVTSFSASIKNNQVMISWKSIFEINNSIFLLERSSNGSTFKEISKVTTSGNNKTNKEYSVKDSETPGKITYYRLTYVDQDGNSEPFEIIALSNNEKAGSDCNLKINPDPCLGKCSITFCDAKPSSFNFSMFDFLGNTLHTNITNKQEASGLEFDTNNYLKPGVFISKITVPLKNTEKKSTLTQ